MTNILVVNASPNTQSSKSRQLVARYVDGLAATNPDVRIVTRDIGITPPPHLDALTLGAVFTPGDQRSEAQNMLLLTGDELIAEVKAADVIVIGSPMHNFGMSSGLKTWFDHVARAGETFRYTENGPEGLLGGRQVVVVTASGGVYTEGAPAQAFNHQLPHIKTLLGFLGLTDITVIEAPGTVTGNAGVETAEARIDELLAGNDNTVARSAA